MTQIYNTDPAGGVKLAVVRVCVLVFTAAGVDESRAKPVIVAVWALKVETVAGPPLTVTLWEVGLKLIPDLFGVTVYVPGSTLAKL